MSARDLATGLYFQYKYEVISRNGEAGWKDDERVKKICLSIADMLTDNKSRKFGILLSGTNGVGKTTMAIAFQKVIDSLSNMIWKDMKGVLLKTSKELSHDISDWEKSEPLLIIDDFGDEPSETMQYGNVSTPLVDLLEYRYDRQLFTFITTNLTPEQIQSKYGMRIRDRLREMMKQITVKEGSYR